MYIVFFCFFSFLWFFPQDSPILQNNERDKKRTPCFLIIEVVVSKANISLSLLLSLSLTSVIILDNEVVMAGLILIDSMILNFTPDSKKISSLQFT
jgi:hypothetical protein